MYSGKPVRTVRGEVGERRSWEFHLWSGWATVTNPYPQRPHLSPEPVPLAARGYRGACPLLLPQPPPAKRSMAVYFPLAPWGTEWSLPCPPAPQANPVNPPKRKHLDVGTNVITLTRFKTLLANSPGCVGR